jgi:hypothetical protein
MGVPVMLYLEIVPLHYVRASLQVASGGLLDASPTLQRVRLALAVVRFPLLVVRFRLLFAPGMV